MIFVTVGYQMAFDRLTTAVDAWAAQHTEQKVFAQVGPDGLPPKHMDWVHFLEPSEFKSHITNCDAIVAHAGMGSILMALQYQKPILVMPRKGSLNETRNDHQIATAKQFESTGQVLVAMDEKELSAQLDVLSLGHVGKKISSDASEELLAMIREFIHGK